MIRRLLLSFVSALALTVLGAVCLRAAAALEQRHALESATSQLAASSRAIEAELNLRGRTVAELSSKLAADPALPAELQAVGDRADHRINPLRGVRPDLDSTTLMNAEGIVVGTDAPRYHVGQSLVAHVAAPDGEVVPGRSSPPRIPGPLDAVLAGYPSRGVSFADGVLYHWGSAPIHDKDKIIGAVLIERRLDSLPALPGCDSFLVVGGKVVVGTWREGWRNLLAGGSDEPVLLARDTTEPMFVERDRAGIWAQRFHVPGSAAPLGFVTVDLTPRFAELASFQHTLITLVILVWLAQLALLLWASRPARVRSGLPAMPANSGRDPRVWLERFGERLRAAREQVAGRVASLRAPAPADSATIVGPPAQLAADKDKDRTPPLGQRVLPGLSATSPSPAPLSADAPASTAPADGTAPPVEAPTVTEPDDDEDWAEATSAMPMTPELMAELGLNEPPDAGLETQVMNVTPEMLADLKADMKAGERAEPKAEPNGEPAEPKAEAAGEPAEPKAESNGEPSEPKAEAAGEPAEPKAEPAEDPVYRELYQRFITMRKMCGQAGEPGFDIFKKSVEKSQTEMMAKHSCQRVRFHVIVKGGKAILTATPLR